MEEKLTELRGVVRDYVRMRNIKRATVIEPRPPFKHPWRGGNQIRGGANPGKGSGQPRDRGGYRGRVYGASRGPNRGRGILW
jgi:hypothetical protein